MAGHAALHSFLNSFKGVFCMKEKVIGTEKEEALERFGLIAPLLMKTLSDQHGSFLAGCLLMEEGISAAELGQRRCSLLQKEEI